MNTCHRCVYISIQLRHDTGVNAVPQLWRPSHAQELHLSPSSWSPGYPELSQWGPRPPPKHRGLPSIPWMGMGTKMYQASNKLLGEHPNSMTSDWSFGGCSPEVPGYRPTYDYGNHQLAWLDGGWGLGDHHLGNTPLLEVHLADHLVSRMTCISSKDRSLLAAKEIPQWRVHASLTSHVGTSMQKGCTSENWWIPSQTLKMSGVDASAYYRQLHMHQLKTVFHNISNHQHHNLPPVADHRRLGCLGKGMTRARMSLATQSYHQLDLRVASYQILGSTI